MLTFCLLGLVSLVFFCLCLPDLFMKENVGSATLLTNIILPSESAMGSPGVNMIFLSERVKYSLLSIVLVALVLLTSALECGLRTCSRLPDKFVWTREAGCDEGRTALFTWWL